MGFCGMGYLVADGLEKFRTQGNNVVRVKGLSERQVKSDFALWPITFQSHGETPQKVRESFSKSREKLENFLKSKDFKPEEITETIPKFSEKRGPEKDAPLEGYVMSGSFKIKTTRVDDVAKYFSEMGQLVAQGSFGVDVVPFNVYNHDTGIRYLIRDFDALRPKMLEESVKSARNMAQKFAEHSDTKVGSIVNADQGSFSITSTEGDYDSSKTLMKNIRVVSTLSYKLQK